MKFSQAVFSLKATLVNRRHPTTIVFDAVGTLITVAGSVGEIYQAAGRQHGSNLGSDEIAARFKHARGLVFSGTATNDELVTKETDQRQKWFQMVSSVFSDVARPEALFEQLWNKFSEPTTWCVYPDVEPVLAQLKRGGFTIAIGSNFDSRFYRIVAGLPALQSVQHVFTSGEIGHAKPSPHFFRAIESSLSVSPSECVMIGDDEVCDQNGAANAGWTSWLIARNRNSGDVSKRILRDLLQLPGLLTGQISDWHRP